MDKQQLNPRNLLPKERLNIIKHYLGQKSEIITNNKLSCLDNGIIEEVDLDKGYGVIKNESSYRHVAPEDIIPKLRKLKNIELEHIKILLNLIVIDNICPGDNLFYIEKKDDNFLKIVRDKTSDNPKIVIFIQSNWFISGIIESKPVVINNYPELVFKLCDLGFDTTNHF